MREFVFFTHIYFNNCNSFIFLTIWIYCDTDLIHNIMQNTANNINNHKSITVVILSNQKNRSNINPFSTTISTKVPAFPYSTIQTNSCASFVFRPLHPIREIRFVSSLYSVAIPLGNRSKGRNGK